ncbi:MAG: hypothetical protein VX712_04415 [Bacteroidota bacterium]|nr:hypothetical protein [Bacteroidota bacterium]
MKQQITAFLRIFLPFTIGLAILHYLILHFVLHLDLYYNIWLIYLFHALITFGIYLALVFVHESFKEKTGFAFMAGSLFKMLLSVLFLLPLMLSDFEKPLNDIFSFFIPYFLYLILETLFAVKLINSK